MEFGISLDQLLVAQRHTLYDSDEEEEEVKGADELFSVGLADGPPLAGEKCSLLIALGEAAVTFVRSYLDLQEHPTFNLVSRTSKVLKGLHFPAHGGKEESDKESSLAVSSAYVAREKQCDSKEGGQIMVVTHDKPLKPEYCNLWAAKVN